MPEILKVALAALGFLLATGLLAWNQRLRLPWASSLLAAALIYAFASGVLIPSDLWLLPVHTDTGPDLALLLSWALFGALLRASGRPWLPGPVWVSAPLLGMVAGEWAAAAILGAAAVNPKAASRLVLAGCGGALIGRMGDPALLILWERGALWGLAPLGLCCLLIAWPRQRHLAAAPAEGGGRRDLSALALAVAVLVPFLGLPALVMGVVGAAIFAVRARRRPDLAPLAWTAAGLALALVALAAGVGRLLAWALERGTSYLPADLVPVTLAVAGALVAAMADGPAAALLGAATLDQALAFDHPHAAISLAAGIGVGSLGPLAIAGAVRAGWWRWLSQVGAAVVFAAHL